jgi:ribosome-associated protein
VAAKKPARKTAPSAAESIHQAALKAAHYALEKKATDIHVLDLKGITTMTDYFIVATGSSERQVKAIAENVISEMRDREGVGAWRSEGWDSLQWVIIDFVDFVVHVFHPTARLYYNIERLWADAPMTEVKDEIPVAKKASATKTTRVKKATAKVPAKSSTSKIKIISDSRTLSAE